MSDVVVLGQVGRDLVLRVAAAGAVVVVAAEELGVDPVRGDGDVLVPLLGERPVDATGAGDVFVATLTAALLGGPARGRGLGRRGSGRLHRGARRRATGPLARGAAGGRPPAPAGLSGGPAGRRPGGCCRGRSEVPRGS